MKNDQKHFLMLKYIFLLQPKVLIIGIFLSFSLSLFAQERTISGIVTGIDGDPIIGATIQVQGTTQGALTDINGRFNLTITPSAKLLNVSFVGMVSKEVAIGPGNSYNIVLTESVVGLDEVVVVGYGTQKKISVTGAIVSVESEFLVKNPTATVSATLAGRVTGLTSVQYSGRPGGDEPQLFVRGLGTLSTNASQPLLLVDGVERPFSQIDPNEIQSISVLKDASATAVYGIRGANGVIIVTTKRGIEGAPKISFSTSWGSQIPTRLVEMADSYVFATKHNEGRLSDNPNGSVVFSDAAINAFKSGGNLIYPNTDWVNYIVKPSALQSQHNFNINGGTKNLKYFVSLGYLNQDGLFNTFETDYSYQFGFKRYNYRTNLDLDLTESTKLSLTIGGRSEVRQEPGSQPSEGIFTVLYWAVPYSGMIHEGKRVLLTNRYIPTTEKKDGLNAIGWGSGYSRATANTMNIDFGINQDLEMITKGLSWRFKFANNSNNNLNKTRTTSKATYDPYYACDVVGGTVGDSTIVFKKSGSDGLLGYSEGSSKGRNWYMETALSYEHSFGNHNVTGLLLYNQNKSFYPSSFVDIPSGYVGIAARATYNYRSKYMLDMNLGYNGSENFAPENRFGFFPAGSVGWTISEESFMKDKISWLDFLKLRASVGTVGNDKSGSSRFLYLPDSYDADDGRYSFGVDYPTDVIEATEGSLGNPIVTWEKAVKQNYGLDMRIFSSRLSISFDVFHETRNNILTQRQTVPSILAISLPAMNIGEVENKGYEGEIRWRDNIGNFNYYIGGNMSFSRNKVIFKDEVPKNEPYLWETGQRVNQPFGYKFAGFWTEEEVANYTEYADQYYVPKPGDVRYQDLNNDGVINADDQCPIGFPDYPEYIASMTAGFDIKGFDFSVLFTGVSNVSRIFTDTWRIPFADLGDRALLKWLAENSWTPETAATAQAPRITFTGRLNNTKTSDLWIKDASYIRLKNIEIGYSIANDAIKRFGISNIRVYANGYNLFTFDRIKFMDPEGRRDYPLIKILNGGLNVTF
jgi:TonB-linked SusC/RagA family outer membrane protein